MRFFSLLFGLTILALIGLGWIFLTNEFRVKPAPDWQLSDLDGKTVKLSDFKGKIVVLNFWATWCEPCVEEIPHFVEVEQEYKDQGLVIIGIVYQDDFKEVTAFAKEKKINYPIVMGDDDASNHYNLEGVPTTFFIDAKGNIVKTHEGLLSKDDLEYEVKKLLSAAPPAAHG